MLDAAAAAAACFGWGSRNSPRRRRREERSNCSGCASGGPGVFPDLFPNLPPRFPPLSPPLLPCGLELGAGMSLSLWTVPCSPGCPVALSVEKPLSPPAEMGLSADCRGRVLGRQQQQQPQRRVLCD